MPLEINPRTTDVLLRNLEFYLYRNGHEKLRISWILPEEISRKVAELVDVEALASRHLLRRFTPGVSLMNL